MKVLVLSDVHANLVAFEAVLQDAGTFDALWNLGDTVGYGPRPRECIDLMVEHSAGPALVGNHDLAALGDLDLTEFNPLAQVASRWTALQLGLEHRAYLRALPAMTVASGFTLAHGSPRAPVWEYVTSAQIATVNFGYFDTPICLVGHTHLAMCAVLRPGSQAAEIFPLHDGEVTALDNARHIVNPGSVGQPRDRDPRAAYLLLDTDRATLTCHRVTYDVATTQRQMALANLPDALAARLAYGM